MLQDVMEERRIGERDMLERLQSVLAAARPSAEMRIHHALGLIAARLSELGGVYEPQTEPPEETTDLVTPTPRRLAGTSPHAGLGRGMRLVGRSSVMREVEQAIQRVSRSTATVLIRGESGTGKELVARAIHACSERAGGPFVPLHCAAVTESLLESELFGHERGAFTGAHEPRKGKFETAHGGTLFLDEIGDIPMTIQVKMLRVLQDKCVERVGGGKSLPVDVRVISATHRDLESMVRAGAFREDLYYRVNVVPVLLPPLREREGDIPLLIAHFLERLNAQNHRHVSLEVDVLALMERYHWPGNVRELQNCIERLVVMAAPGCERIALSTVPPSLRGYFHDMRHVTASDDESDHERPPGKTDLTGRLQDIERDRIRDALHAAGWVQARAARALGLSARQVAYKIRKYGLRDETAVHRGESPIS